MPAYILSENRTLILSSLAGVFIFTIILWSSEAMKDFHDSKFTSSAQWEEKNARVTSRDIDLSLSYSPYSYESQNWRLTLELELDGGNFENFIFYSSGSGSAYKKIDKKIKVGSIVRIRISPNKEASELLEPIILRSK